MEEDLPPHIDEELYQLGKEHFSSSEFDSLREYVRAVQDSDIDLSGLIMNVQGTNLEPVNDVEPPTHEVGWHTISEYINEEADVARLEETDMDVEDAFTSWSAGALAALKK